MPTQTHETVVQNGSGAYVARGTATKTANAEFAIGSTIANSGNDVYTMDVDVSNIVAFWFISDKAVTLTINDDGSPDETYALAASVPFAWHDSLGTANPLTHDWTSIKIANASGATAIVTGAVLVAV